MGLDAFTHKADTSKWFLSKALYKVFAALTPLNSYTPSTKVKHRMLTIGSNLGFIIFDSVMWTGGRWDQTCFNTCGFVSIHVCTLQFTSRCYIWMHTNETEAKVQSGRPLLSMLTPVVILLKVCNSLSCMLTHSFLAVMIQCCQLR